MLSFSSRDNNFFKSFSYLKIRSTVSGMNEQRVYVKNGTIPASR